MEHFIETNQALSMFDIFTYDGLMYQVIGFAGDAYVLDAIEYEDGIETVELDVEDIINFTLDEELYG